MGSKEERDAEMQRALEFRLPKGELKGIKPTYTKSNILGKEDRFEGKAASRASRRDKGRRS